MTMGGREADGDKIQWTRLNQPWFDRIVETLLLRKFRSVATVDVVDGRGGDEGVDIAVTYPNGNLSIYQLKYYPEGMSGGFVKRREKVKDSFLRAVKKHQPHEWFLVAPRNYTSSEKRFIRRLPNFTPEETRRPTVEWMGQAELDQLLIDYPEVDRWLTLDHYRRTRQIFEHERAAFLEAPAVDLADRVHALGELVDARDEDWTWDFARHAGTTVQTLRAQNDNAAQRSPISIAFTTMFDTDSAVGREFRRSIEYGTPGRVEIPGTALTHFHVEGPELVQGIPDPTSLVMWSLPIEHSPAVGMLMEIKFLDSGNVVASEEGTVTEVHHGTRGITNVMSFCGGRLTLSAEIPLHANSGPTSMDVSYNIQGLSPRTVADLLEVVLRLRVSDEVQFHIDGHFLTKYIRSEDQIDENDHEFKERLIVHHFASDLARVLAHTGQSMTFPSSISADDRVHARVAQLLLGGDVVASPVTRRLEGQLDPDATLTPELRTILAGRCDARWPSGLYEAPIAGRNHPLGQSIALHPETWVENGNAALESLERGDTYPDTLIVRPGDDPYFFFYLPDIEPEGNGERSFAGWSLIDIDEPWLERSWLRAEGPLTE